jgi:4-amino-4-deoxy-L-arabinose transferase-like glycosyltransferase
MMSRRVSIQFKIILIILGCAAVYLAGNARVSLWDRDEPRYAQTSRQMLQSGDWVVPHLLDKIRTAKPIFIYWCQASAMKIFGGNEFAARFPSALAMTLALVVLAIAISRTVGPSRAMWTIFVLGTSALAIAAAKMCLTDGVLLFFVTSAQACLGLLYARPRTTFLPLPLGEGRGEGVLENQSASPREGPLTLALSRRARGSNLHVAIFMWIAIAFAGLTKGPPVLGISFTTMLVLAIFDRAKNFAWWARTRPILGIVILTIICAPWLILIHQRSPGFLESSIGHEVIDRMRTPQEGHGGKPGTYLLVICAGGFPWSLLFPAAILHAWRRRHLPAIRFALSAVIGPWLMFELIPTKLPFYILPIFPFLAFLTADMLVRAGRKVHDQLSNKGFVKIVGIWCAIVVVVACLPWMSVRMFKPYINSISIASMVLATLIAIAYVGGVYVSFRADRPLRAAAVMGIGMMLIVLVMYVGYFPSAQFLRTSQRIADVLHEHAGKDAMMIDYKEDSLPWCEGGTIRPQRDNDFLVHNPPQMWPNFLVLTGEVWRKTPFEIQDQFEILGGYPIRGWDYSDHLPSTPGAGRVVDVFVLRKK